MNPCAVEAVIFLEVIGVEVTDVITLFVDDIPALCLLWVSTVLRYGFTVDLHEGRVLRGGFQFLPRFLYIEFCKDFYMQNMKNVGKNVPK